ncbi:hypothetical protein SERLA73DRAFT_163128 [Serpula lacrymans var. lacrymans S7.3]|uniref:Uncharacterized protein n=2 Tax=Serpula lacrymans var. lacrymans TaxID=341189 RepID=F8QBT0_SERL3|nr:uncharacterized protein SERLADRAFT_418281 [Serpula lacrymans var. lacrymans S7.9]EGN94049.1 hypothetical protein SERLA73DRAFT_163128 [Serpula lacrymans var. lacrymans S7.3]EGO19402.1 hypothetical protein SERLADRAFT_418281 [Serpula lacrymans var. lacrymans S7.9]
MCSVLRQNGPHHPSILAYDIKKYQKVCCSCTHAYRLPSTSISTLTPWDVEQGTLFEGLHSQCRFQWVNQGKQFVSIASNNGLRMQWQSLHHLSSDWTCTSGINTLEWNISQV